MIKVTSYRAVGRSENAEGVGVSNNFLSSNNFVGIIYPHVRTLTIILATLRRWCTVPHRFAARHSLGAHRAALQMYHYVQTLRAYCPNIYTVGEMTMLFR